MDGIATILDAVNLERVNSLWRDLQLHCSIPDTQTHLLPHFSWHVAKSYDHEPLLQVLADLCGQLQPFTVRTAGLGIFSGEKPIIYINLVKDQKIIEVHRKLWEAFTPFAHQPSEYYSPDYWMPHITIYFDEIFNELPEGWETYNKTMCVLNQLISQRYGWSIAVDNLAYGRMDGNRMQFQHYPFDCVR